ncbi:hypothetical protein A8C32_16030 [Flavivirga aquatica]|uniref:Secretion system C-terminal sorting domain-containing protein n=1 Tax=Flavivirga aquatica TaxID=1849968 RepID=A0A1E5T9B2_9FLAO|nr:T9SS type A sorting domain-containing protein [Flavivirga aquatica]OEK07969.1 hypothetical protein A8C32_16030 [Flavivirga aquatica]
MKKTLHKILLSLLAIIAFSSNQLIAQPSYTFTADVESWTGGAQVNIAQAAETGTDGVLNATPSGNMQFPRLDRMVSIDASIINNLKIVLKNTGGAEMLRLRVASPENPGGGQNNWITIADISSNDTDFKTYIVNDISAAITTTPPNEWTGTVTNLQFQFKNGTDTSIGADPILIDEISFSGTPFTLSLNDVTKDDASVSVLPNPVRDELTIKVPTAVSKIEIYNILGQKALTKIDSDFLNVSSLSRGIYIAKIFQGNKISTKRFVKN